MEINSRENTLDFIIKKLAWTVLLTDNGQKGKTGETLHEALSASFPINSRISSGTG